MEVVRPSNNHSVSKRPLPRLGIEPVTRQAATLLTETALHDHKHAIDAILSATALPQPVTILTSDPADLYQQARRHHQSLTNSTQHGDNVGRSGLAHSAAHLKERQVEEEQR